MTTFVTLLYVSRVASSHPVDVQAIARQARAANAMHGITGLLAFDGTRFAQLVEGPADAIAELHGNLTRDPRHEDMRTLYLDITGENRRFPTWELGYLKVQAGDGHDLSLLDQARGPMSVLMFDKVVGKLDLAVAEAIPTAN